MIVTCPGCETKYEVIEDALIPNGRILRCVRCGHKWTQRPPVSENYPNELSEELTDNDFPGNDDESEDDSIRSFEDSGNDPIKHFSVKLSIDDKIISKARDTSKKKAEEKASKRAFFMFQVDISRYQNQNS